jgi:2-polyprenyl-3-methyl-5-hydroxy-6-metoxy-1,4-benzoquinol methylase
MGSRTDEVKTFFDKPERYLRHDFGVRLRGEIVRDLLGSMDKGGILDAGCGDGSVSLQFLKPGVSITLLDLSEQMLAVARSRTPPDRVADVRFVQGDVLDFEPAAPFDVVLCLGLLAHVGSVDGAIGKLVSFVKPGGHCVLQLTDQAKAIARVDAAGYAIRRRFVDERGYGMNYLTKEQVVLLSQQHGLRLLRDRRYSLLLPGMGRLPLRWLYRYQRLTLERPWLSRHGSEVILLLRKGDG